MPRGRFRLARVAKLNEQLRREKEREVKSTVASIDEAQARARLTERAREEASERAQAQALREARDLQLFRQFDARLADRQHALERAADLLGEELERRRAELMERRREERKFDQLEAAQESRCQESKAKRSALQMDEMALVAHARRRRAEKEKAGR